ncbi:GNAT family N-acetyltransferase [Luteibacter sp. 329MFSha]|uniref:GNAT family N-acetyltransferase n=1 Tax=Luteibacter sp. 329MFSha TaxID=1798239 RepID=UPI0008CC3B6D|nr:GNAT family N-acetyltransferase [Luteibacter sp. 329MFSha]SEW17882.1 Acetyltransferase (GNAT) domain-containing protein [Luteibacter sp. 329MFSha]
MAFVNQLEPDGLLGHFERHPPQGFTPVRAADSAPLFVAPFDLLTTADDDLRRRVDASPFRGWLRRSLTLRTCFAGTTVSEYALFDARHDPAAVPRAWAHAQGRRQPLFIVKDIALDSPLTSPAERAWTARFVDAARDAGYVMVEGQALAYVPIDFASIDEYLARLSSSRRKNLRRKLRSRDGLQVDEVPTGPAFADDAVVDAFYALFENVHAQSDIHFDKPTREFFAAVLRDAGGLVFTYRVNGELIGWNLCYEHAGKLLDKYVGFAYPAARDADLYFVSWFVNLEYALRRGLSHYVAGWTDPAVKASLGARFHLTRHAVYVRNPLLRVVLRRFAHRFEAESAWGASDAIADRS